MTQAPAPFQQVSVGAPPVAAPSPKSQEMVLVRRSEIAQIRRGVVRALSDPVESAWAWAAVWFGVAAAAGLSLLALTGVEGNHVRTGILAAHWAALIGGLFLALFCAYFGWRNGERRVTGKQDLCADLDELNERAQTTITEAEAPKEELPVREQTVTRALTQRQPRM